MKSIVRIFFVLAVTLSLTFGAFSVTGFSTALAASSQPTAADGLNPVAADPSGMGYCYPSGYNRQGWRCGWRLAMAPYNLGDYYNNYYYYGYNGYYNGYNGYNGYNNGYYNGYYPGQYGNYNGNVVDYGGRPRFGSYNYGYYYNYNYGCYCK